MISLCKEGKLWNPDKSDESICSLLDGWFAVFGHDMGDA